MTYTYKATLREGQGMNLSESGSIRPTVTGIVLRSDGKTVLSGNTYFDTPAGRRSAQAFVNMQVGRFRKYQEREGVCWFDRRAERLAWEKTRAGIRSDTARELQDAASMGTKAFAAGEPQEACPFGVDTVQGIIWTQAWRLTADRMGDWLDTNPKPPTE